MQGFSKTPSEGETLFENTPTQVIRFSEKMNG